VGWRNAEWGGGGGGHTRGLEGREGRLVSGERAKEEDDGKREGVLDARDAHWSLLDGHDRVLLVQRGPDEDEHVHNLPPGGGSAESPE